MLLCDDDAEFSVLDNYGPFMEELGLIENDGDGGGGAANSTLATRMSFGVHGTRS